MAPNMTSSVIDVLIIGGGPAGLSVATGLARQVYSAVVFDHGVYRNARASHMHNVPGWDHTPPAEFRAKARTHLLDHYTTIRFEQAAIQQVSRTDAGQFEALDDQGRSWRGRKLVLAHGTTDVFPEIPGYDECWGYGIYACLFCHGYEDRGVHSAGILCTAHAAAPPVALHLSRMARRFTRRMTLYTNGDEELGKELESQLERDSDGRAGLVKVNSQPISRLARGSGRDSEVIVTLAGGSQFAEGFLAHQPFTRVSAPFARQLSLELTPTGDIKTSQPFHETTVPGVFAVGDCASPMKAVSQAAAMGALAAGGLAAQLGAELYKAE